MFPWKTLNGKLDLGRGLLADSRKELARRARPFHLFAGFLIGGARVAITLLRCGPGAAIGGRPRVGLCLCLQFGGCLSALRGGAPLARNPRRTTWHLSSDRKSTEALLPLDGMSRQLRRMDESFPARSSFWTRPTSILGTRAKNLLPVAARPASKRSACLVSSPAWRTHQ